MAGADDASGQDNRSPLALRRLPPVDARVPRKAVAELLRPDPPRSWRDRADDLAELARRSPGVMVAAVAAVALGVGALALLHRPAPPPETTMPRARSEASPATSAPEETVVDVSGAVARPGLYRLTAGARVDDAVRAAGGPAGDADLDRVNLAAKVADGQRVYVPHQGQAAPPDELGAGSDGPLDLNAATLEQLDGLPGVGPATAQAILDYRAAHGAFHSINELLRVRGIGDARFAALRARVRV